MSMNIPEEFSWFKRIVIQTRGYAYLVDHMRHRWRASLPFYIVKCHEHGIVEDVPHSHSGHLTCPICSRRKHIGLRAQNL